MINSESKDLLLSYLIDSGIHSSFRLSEKCADFNLDSAHLEIILDQFVDLNFIRMERFLGGTVWVTLTAYAFDFMQKGGFTAKEAIEKASLDKLHLELQSLKETFPERADRLTSVMANIATVISLFAVR